MRWSLALSMVVMVACDEPSSKITKPVPTVEPSVAPPLPIPEGCARNGPLDGVESDPSCVLARVGDNAMRELGKAIQLTATLQPDTLAPGAASVLRITIANEAATETLLALDLQSRPPGPRTDWGRIAGVPDTKPGAIEIPRLFFGVSTLDSREKSVDAVPTLPGGRGEGSAGNASTTKTIGIRMKPNGKVTYITQWWAMRIPAPFPPVTDDAGHRFVPKTQPFPLPVGTYSVVTEVPLHGLTTPERLVTVQAHVEKPIVP